MNSLGVSNRKTRPGTTVEHGLREKIKMKISSNRIRIMSNSLRRQIKLYVEQQQQPE